MLFFFYHCIRFQLQSKMRTFYKVILFVYLALTFCTQKAAGQDYNFSQFWENRSYYNPAYAGINQGEVNALLTYRKLWPKFQGNFSTIFFSADIKTYNSYGFGLYFISSDEGGGFIKSNTVGLSYSWRGNINKEKGSFFQLGIKGSYNDERLSFDRYKFSGQLHEIYGDIFPQPVMDGIKNNQNYWDFSLGAMIYLPWELNYKEFMRNYLGVAVSHFTRPKDNFIEENYRLPIKISLQWNSFIRTGIRTLDKQSFMYVCPGLIFENQGNKLLSSSSSNNMMIGSDLTTDPIFGGIWYSSQLLNNSPENYKAVIFKLGLKFRSDNKRFEYRLAYTYDMSLGNLAKTTEGSHEISINLVYRFNAKYKYNIFSL